ncbi:MAG TPA: hypothetical protein VK941_01330 [Gillisia sp.]|nr:hypothetical protein [Gillisia sp.]
MEKYQYICHYCGKEYVPGRRRVQKYCRTSCRVNAYNERIKKTAPPSEKGLSVPQKENLVQPGISLGGIGNAAIAYVATDLAKSVFIKEDNKPATKGDLKALLTQNQERYLPVVNAPQKSDGTKAFYDSVSKIIVYRSVFPFLTPIIPKNEIF